ncbi:MAG: hypothetical protein WKF30_18350 [Pyrinomonadaceae bacterium]
MRSLHTRGGVALCLLLALFINPLKAAQQQSAPSTFRPSAYITRVQKVLTENIASFWFDKALDHKNGGYIISYGPRGELRENGTKRSSHRRARCGFSRAWPAPAIARVKRSSPPSTDTAFCASACGTRVTAVFTGKLTRPAGNN